MSGSARNLIIAIVATALVVAGTVYLLLYFFGASLLPAANQGQPPQFNHMTLQGQYAGPLAGTVVQRWRDPVDGTVCYIYMPMIVHHTPAPSGYVEYGPNFIGSISCLPGSAAGSGQVKQ